MPPAVALEHKAIGHAPASSGGSSMRAKVDIHIPQDVAKKEKSHTQEHGSIELLWCPVILDMHFRQRVRLEDDARIQQAIRCLVNGWVLEMQVDRREQISSGKNAHPNQDRAASVSEFRENTPKWDARGVDHGKFIQELVFVPERHVKAPWANSNKHEAQGQQLEAKLQVVVVSVENGESSQRNEHSVGGGVQGFSDKWQHHVVFLAPVDGRRGDAPVALVLLGRVRDSKGKHNVWVLKRKSGWKAK